MLDEATLRKKGLRERDLASIRRRHRGGVAGAEGVRYEDNYAVHRLLDGTVRRISGGAPERFRGQAFCFVDDLVVQQVAHHEYCQLKKSPSETWEKDNGKLKREFRGQVRICKRLGDPYALTLVNPDPACVGRLRSTTPKGLRKVTRVEQFPMYTRRPEAWSTSSGSHALIAELCAFGVHHSNQREQIVLAFYNAWFDVSPETDGFIEIDRVIEHVRKDETVPLRFQCVVNTPEWASAQQVISNIADLEVRIDHGFCHYKYMNEEGLIARCDTQRFTAFVNRVNKDRPATFDQFLETFV